MRYLKVNILDKFTNREKKICRRKRRGAGFVREKEIPATNVYWSKSKTENKTKQWAV